MDDFRGQEHAILAALGINWHGSRKVSGKMRCPFPHHEDVHPSWRWSESGRSDGRPGWICSCGAGDILDAVEAMGRAHGLIACKDWARDAIGAQPARKSTAKSPKTGEQSRESSPAQSYQPANQPPTLAQLCHARWRRPSAVYLYHDADELIAEVRARYDHEGGGKDVIPWSFDGARWVPRQMPGKRPLYRLPALLADPFSPVLFVEGESRKHERALELFGDHVVTSCSGGCTAAKGMDFAPIAGRSVVIWPDNDEPGRKHADDVARLALAAGASEVRVVDVPRDWPQAWDLGDEPPSDSVDLREMLDEAQLWQPQSDSFDEARQNAADSCLFGARSCEIDADVSESVSHESFSGFETQAVPMSKASVRQEAEIIPFSTLSSAAVSPTRQDKAAPASKFKLTRFRDIKPVLSGMWLIKGLLPARGLCTVFGEPGCGKSFLTLDMALHVAAGRDYAGRKVKQARVVYIAAEGQGGFRNRVMEAAKLLDLGADLQFDLIEVAPNLGVQDGDAAELIAAIEAQSEPGDSPVGAIVIDTTSQTMGGQNENLEGMATFIVNANSISAHFACLSIAIHHVGKSDTQTPRGWSGLHGANDAEIKVSGLENPHGALICKQKDGEPNWSFQFNLNRAEVGVDEDGDVVTTCTVETLDTPIQAAAPSKTTGQRLPRRQREFDTAFTEALLASGVDYYIDGDGPMVRAIYVHQIRSHFAKRWATDEQDKRARQKKTSDAFKSTLKTLPPKYHTRTEADGERIWRTS